MQGGKVVNEGRDCWGVQGECKMPLGVSPVEILDPCKDCKSRMRQGVGWVDLQRPPARGAPPRSRFLCWNRSKSVHHYVVGGKTGMWVGVFGIERDRLLIAFPGKPEPLHSPRTLQAAT